MDVAGRLARVAQSHGETSSLGAATGGARLSAGPRVLTSAELGSAQALPADQQQAMVRVW